MILESLKRKRKAILKERQDARNCSKKKMKWESDVKFPEPFTGLTLKIPFQMLTVVKLTQSSV